MTASALCLLIVFALDAQAQTPSPSPTPAQTPAQSSAPCAPPPSCPALAPHVFQVSVNLKQSDKSVPVARKSLYLSPCPFNLEKLPAQATRAPSRKSYYAGAKASPQLINWLEANNCDTVYCRELRREEVTCNASDASCVPEFVQAYNEALSKLKDPELARKWVTNYAPLSAAPLRTGFHDEKMKWLAAEVAAVEKASGLPLNTIRSTVTDRQGIAYFYDLCPGAYYISNLAPVEVGGDRILWETTAIKVEKSDTLEKIPVTLSNVSAKKKNYFVGKKIAETVSSLGDR